MHPIREDVEALARHAGKILRAGYGSEHDVDHKGEIDLVTEIDHRAEAYLLGEIRSRFPDHRIIAEESGTTSGNQCCRWYVDPLDGTVNYAYNIPIFCVSLAYEQNGQMQLGVVYDPMRDECFSAERGQGAWLNGDPIRVSSANTLDQSLLVTGFPYDIRTNPENNLDHYARFALNSLGVRRLGSAALDLCYVAAGRFDGFWEIRIKSWDIAAGGLIAEEAGALVTNIYGGPDYLSEPQSVVAANDKVHPQIVALLQDGR